MKAGHYLRWAEKSFDILTKFHGRMFDLGGEESDLWSDDAIRSRDYVPIRN